MSCSHNTPGGVDRPPLLVDRLYCCDCVWELLLEYGFDAALYCCLCVGAERLPFRMPMGVDGVDKVFNIPYDLATRKDD